MSAGARQILFCVTEVYLQLQYIFMQVSLIHINIVRLFRVPRKSDLCFSGLVERPFLPSPPHTARYKCRRCSKSYKFYNTFVLHFKTCGTGIVLGGNWKCPCCTYMSPKIHLLKSHMGRKHPAEFTDIFKQTPRNRNASKSSNTI